MAAGSGTVRTRRQLLVLGGTVGFGLAVGARARGASPAAHGGTRGAHARTQEEEISPAEDLMREHGVLERLLLIYQASMARVAQKDAVPLPVVVKAADLTRRLVEDYHERLEEQDLFPRFEAARTLVDLVGTLRAQHQPGRLLTDEIRRIAAAGAPAALADDRGLSSAVDAFVRMYRPHAAREETVLFPAFRKLVKAREYAELGEQFEDKEHALFGRGGFDDVVGQVAELETAVGIYQLAQFTPA